MAEADVALHNIIVQAADNSRLVSLVNNLSGLRPAGWQDGFPSAFPPAPILLSGLPAAYPIIAGLKRLMEKNGARKALMSGSGPTVFGI